MDANEEVPITKWKSILASDAYLTVFQTRSRDLTSLFDLEQLKKEEEIEEDITPGPLFKTLSESLPQPMSPQQDNQRRVMKRTPSSEKRARCKSGSFPFLFENSCISRPMTINLQAVLDVPTNGKLTTPRKHTPVPFPELRKMNDAIFQDEELKFKKTGSHPELVGGTKSKLLDLLVNTEFIEIDYISEFLGVYPYFASCSEVLLCLRAAYQYPEIPKGIGKEEESAFVSATRKRVMFVLYRWMYNFPSHFDNATKIADLTSFINSLSDEEQKERLLALLAQKVSIKRETFDFLTPRIINEQTKSPLFLKSTAVLAQNFCLLDHKQFCEVPLNELRNQLWTSDNPFHIAPKITRCIEFFNRVSYWSATQILSEKNIKQRLQVMKRLISLAQVLVNYQNYNTAFAIISSLTYASIKRLKKTWRHLPAKYLEMFERMKELCSVEQHYIPYKKLLLTQPPPSIPYLGVYLRDITFIETGNPTYLDEKQTIINYEKFRMLSDILLDFKKYQQVKYQFTPDPQIQTALRYSMTTMDEEEQYNVSVSLEPVQQSTQKRKLSSSLVAKLKDHL